MPEIWKDITDFPSYEVSDLGHVRNKNTQHMKTTWHDNDGYLKVTLMKFDNGKKSYRKTVHRLVAEAFMGGKHDTLQVNHINGIKDDNRVTNLEWVTGSENVKHAYDTGLRRPSGGRGEIRKVRVVESGGVYDNLHECAKAIGSDSGNISKCLHEKADTVKGYHLEYADTDTIAKPFLFEHQKEAVKRMFDGCILNGGVGSGKSRTSLFYYFKEYGGWIDENGYTPMKNPKDLFIITTAMKRDKLEWNLELSPFLLSTNPDENHYNNKVIIDSWNNIQKYAEVKDAFFIFDEDRVTGDGVWVKAFLKIAKSNRWIILSATPGDTWKDYIPVFIANGFYKNKTEFAREHIVWNPRVKFPKVDRYLNTGRLIRLRNRILVDMDFDRPTTAHHEDIYVKYNVSMYRDAGKLRWDPYKDEPIQNAAGLCYVWRKIVKFFKKVFKNIKLVNELGQPDKEKVNNMATSLSISDGNLFLSNDSGIIENSGVILPSGSGGAGIQSIEQTTISTQDEGVNVITATLTDGTSSTFEVRNGSKGTTPTKGTDYWTSEDIAQIESYCKNYIDTELLGAAS